MSTENDTKLDERMHIATAGGDIYAPSWAAVAKLHAKIAAAMAAVDAVQRDGRHALGYRYTTYAEAAGAIRAALAQSRLAFSYTEEPPPQNGQLVTATIIATFTDTETGAMRTARWHATGRDHAAAATISIKQGLLHTFLVPTAEDQEPTKAQDKPQAAHTAQAKPPTAPKPPAPPAAPQPTIDAATGEVDPGTPAQPQLSRQAMMNEIAARYRGKMTLLSAYLMKGYAVSKLPELSDGDLAQVHALTSPDNAQ